MTDTPREYTLDPAGAHLTKQLDRYTRFKTITMVTVVLLNLFTAGFVVYSTLILLDCTIPRGQCAERQKANTQTVLQRIAEHDEATTFCANRLDVNTRDKLRACIEKELNK